MIKDRFYTVSQTKDKQRWYVHRAGYSYIPVFGTFVTTKKEAQKLAAMYMGIPYKVYIKLPERRRG